MLFQLNSAIILIILFVILLLFVWKQSEYRMRKIQELKPETSTFDNIPRVPSDFEIISDESIIAEAKDMAIERQKETCKDIDPVLSFYSREYKNRWREVKPNINAVGFTPIAKRCAYPGAPCEWQDKVEPHQS